MRAPTALLIPCPWSGDENEPSDWRYTAWYWLYRRTRLLRHRLGLHDWAPMPDPWLRRCSWCGACSERRSDGDGWRAVQR